MFIAEEVDHGTAAEVEKRTAEDSACDKPTYKNYKDAQEAVEEQQAEQAAEEARHRETEPWKRGLSEGFSEIGSGFSQIGGSIKNSTVSLWHKLVQDEKTPQQLADEKTAADLKFINKRGRNGSSLLLMHRTLLMSGAAPVPVQAPSRNAPVPANRNAPLPQVAAIPLTPIAILPMVKGAKRSHAEIERSLEKWNHIRSEFCGLLFSRKTVKTL